MPDAVRADERPSVRCSGVSHGHRELGVVRARVLHTAAWIHTVAGLDGCEAPVLGEVRVGMPRGIHLLANHLPDAAGSGDTDDTYHRSIYDIAVNLHPLGIGTVVNSIRSSSESLMIACSLPLGHT